MSPETPQKMHVLNELSSDKEKKWKLVEGEARKEIGGKKSLPDNEHAKNVRLSYLNTGLNLVELN